MKISIVLVCALAVTFARAQQRPPPGGQQPPPPGTQRPPQPQLDPHSNNRSMCGTRERTCLSTGDLCIEKREVESERDAVINECQPRGEESDSCGERQFVQPDQQDRRNDQDVFLDVTEVDHERNARETQVGAHDRSTARTISGALRQVPCSDGLRCQNDVCMTPSTPSMCEMRRTSDRQTNCDREGMFNPLQCRREEDSVTCHCVNTMTGSMIPDSRREVTDRREVPDCNQQSFRSCRISRDDRNIEVRHGDSVPMRQEDACMSCECRDGEFTCSAPRESNARCSRSDPREDEQPQGCRMEGGEMLQHNEQTMDGECNRCGCRNGTLQCTSLPECRRDGTDDDDEESDNSEGEMRERMCEECMNMPSSPVCSVRDGRTFPTRCHALRCQGYQAEDLEDRACAERNACDSGIDEESCSAGANCMQRGGQTRMTRENDSPDNRRLCIMPTEARCLPTRNRTDGLREIDTSSIRSDPFPQQRGEQDQQGERPPQGMMQEGRPRDDTDRSVCASDGNSYPSTCHMIIESSSPVTPRVMHPGNCDQDSNEPSSDRMVCGRDGMTYSDERVMRTQGGNTDVDYRGQCAQPSGADTPNSRCQMVRDEERCPDMTSCERMTMPADGCCPICGSSVLMAMDQEAVDEQVRTTGRPSNLDDFMGGFLRNTSSMEPLIRPEATRRCNISTSRPTTLPGNVTETMFVARDMASDAMFCHDQAMRMTRMLNDAGTRSGTTTAPISREGAVVAAAIVAPELVVGEDNGATTLTASCLLLLGSFLMAAIF